MKAPRSLIQWIDGTRGCSAHGALLAAIAVLILGAVNLQAQGEQVFKGKICVGPEGRTPTIEDGQPTLPCIVPHPKKESGYILFNPDTKATYQLDARGKARHFTGRHVIVLGNLAPETSTIHVDEILDAIPQQVLDAKTVYIDCDNCVRGMAAAWKAAFEVVEDWGRFEVSPDPKKADLIFLFAANPYGGDYVTRDGPDTRGVKVEITYMNVVDPHTGKNLWGDSRDWGSFFVAKATRSLIDQLRMQMALEKQPDGQTATEKTHIREAAPPLGSL